MNSFLVELRRMEDQVEKTPEDERPPTVPVAKQVRGCGAPCTQCDRQAVSLWPPSTCGKVGQPSYMSRAAAVARSSSSA